METKNAYVLVWSSCNEEGCSYVLRRTFLDLELAQLVRDALNAKVMHSDYDIEECELVGVGSFEPADLTDDEKIKLVESVVAKVFGEDVEDGNVYPKK